MMVLGQTMWKGPQLSGSYFGTFSAQRLSSPHDVTDLGNAGKQVMVSLAEGVYH